MLRRAELFPGIAVVLIASGALWPAVANAQAKALPDISGDWQSQALTLSLAVRASGDYIGLLVDNRDQAVRAVKVRCDVVKGCHGVAYDGNLANQRGFSLALGGDILSLQWPDEPALALQRKAGSR